MNNNRNTRKKSRQLGMNYSTATSRLKKLMLFELVKMTKQDTCFHCGEYIESADELSVEHMKPWLDNSPALFWDLSNIGYSHLKCNSGAGRKPRAVHGTTVMYKTHKCKCKSCTKANTLLMRRYRLKHPVRSTG